MITRISAVNPYQAKRATSVKSSPAREGVNFKAGSFSPVMPSPIDRGHALSDEKQIELYSELETLPLKLTRAGDPLLQSQAIESKFRHVFVSQNPDVHVTYYPGQNLLAVYREADRGTYHLRPETPLEATSRVAHSGNGSPAEVALREQVEASHQGFVNRLEAIFRKAPEKVRIPKVK